MAQAQVIPIVLFNHLPQLQAGQTLKGHNDEETSAAKFVWK